MFDIEKSIGVRVLVVLAVLHHVEILLTAHTLCRSNAVAAHTSGCDSLVVVEVPVPHREHTGHTGVTCDPRLNELHSFYGVSRRKTR